MSISRKFIPASQISFAVINRVVPFVACVELVNIILDIFTQVILFVIKIDLNRVCLFSYVCYVAFKSTGSHVLKR